MTITVTPAMKKRFQEEAQRRSLTLSEFVRDSVLESLSLRKKRLRSFIDDFDHDGNLRKGSPVISDTWASYNEWVVRRVNELHEEMKDREQMLFRVADAEREGMPVLDWFVKQNRFQAYGAEKYPDLTLEQRIQLAREDARKSQAEDELEP